MTKNIDSKITVFVGSYTLEGSPAPKPTGEGISIYEFDKEDYSLNWQDTYSLRNPSYLATSPDSSKLYAVEELLLEEEPTLTIFQVKDKKLKVLYSEALPGGYSCHVLAENDKLIISNYDSGNGIIYNLNNDGLPSGKLQLVQHEGQGVNLERQEKPHVHMSYPWKDNYYYLVDLGLDSCMCYHWNEERKEMIPEPEYDLRVPSGFGPRHMVIEKTNQFAFVVNELKPSITLFEFSKVGVTRHSTTPIQFPFQKKQGAASAILIHPNNKVLYAACRESNTVSVLGFDKKNKEIQIHKIYTCEGVTPRDMNLSKDGNFLFVANQDSNTVVTFKVDASGKSLKYLKSETVQSPSCIEF